MRGGDLAGDQIEEAAIVVVEQAERIEAGDQDAGPAGLAARRDRQHDRLVRRLAASAPLGKSGPNAIVSSVTTRGACARAAPRRAASMPALERERPARPRGWSRSIPVVLASTALRLAAARPGRSGRTAGRAGRSRAPARCARRPAASVRASRGRCAASSRSSASCRSPITRWVSSVLAQKMPPTRAVVGRNRAVGEGVVGLLGIAVALHDQELRLDVGALVAAHRLWRACGPMSSQISRQTSEVGRPSAQGCLPPMIDL